MPITVSGTSITFNDSTTQTTAFTGGGGTVTSVATGNGLQGGTITTSGTLSVACPTFNTVGSYAFIVITVPLNGSISSGTNYSAGGGNNQIQTVAAQPNRSQNNLSGTWKYLGAGWFNEFADPNYGSFAIACRVS